MDKAKFFARVRTSLFGGSLTQSQVEGMELLLDEVPAHWPIDWLAMALAGGYLPPVEAYLMDQETPDGAPKLHPYAEPIGPMTEEEAMEYLVAKDIPRRVWDSRLTNRPRFKIVLRSSFPTDQTYRNSWQFKELAA